jgi:hypothetical protein
MVADKLACPPFPRRKLPNFGSKGRMVLVLALALAGLAFAPGAARADFTVTLDTANTNGSGFTGPFVRVDVAFSGLSGGLYSTATVTFTSLYNGGDTYLMGGTSGIDLNIGNGTGSGFTYGSPTFGQFSGFSASSVQSTGSGNADGFGTFDYNLNMFDGYTHSAKSVTVVFTDTGGGWKDGGISTQNFLVANNNDALAAAHIFAVSGSTPTADESASTFYVAGNGSSTPPVNTAPVPSSMALALSGFVTLGLVNMGRLRRKFLASA